MSASSGSKSARLRDAAGAAFAKGRWAEALELARRYLKGKPGDAAAHHLASLCAWRAADRALALAHACKAARLAPRNYRYRIEYARMLILTKDASGVEESEAALALRPDDPDARRAHAVILFNGPTPDKALPALEDLCADLPEDGELHAMRAALLLARKDHEAALAAADAARAAGVRAAELSEFRGRALLAFGRAEEARDAFAAALKAEPARLVSLRGLSAASAGLGDYKAARRAAAEHVRLLPFETVGAATAPLTLMVGNMLGRDSAFAGAYDGQAYGVMNYIGTFAHPDVRVIHYAPNYIASTDVKTLCGGADLIFNNIGNAEMIAEGGGGARLAASYAATGLPVLNDVAATEKTTRDGNYQRFGAGHPFIFPRTERFPVGPDPRDAAKAMLERFEPPFLVRPAHTNVRMGLRLVRDADAFLEDPQLVPGDACFAIAYHPSTYAGQDGVSGALQFRASVIGSRIFADRVVWSPGDFTEGHPDRFALDYEGRGLFDLEWTYLTAPETLFGASLEDIFGRMVAEVGLDVFGIDFGIGAGGEIIVFEVNATMHLFPVGDLSYRPYRDELRDTFDTYFIQHMKRRIEG